MSLKSRVRRVEGKVQPKFSNIIYAASRQEADSKVKAYRQEAPNGPDPIIYFFTAIEKNPQGC